MSDIRTVFIDMEHGSDYAIESMLLAQDDGLTTSVLQSLFTDRRAGPDDVIPGGAEDRRGTWMDAFADEEGDRMGSRLWRFERRSLGAFFHPISLAASAFSCDRMDLPGRL